jgi:hypothetical protein
MSSTIPARVYEIRLVTIRPASIIVAHNDVVVSVLGRRQFFDRLRHRKIKGSSSIECVALCTPRADWVDSLRVIVWKNASMSVLR